jgi:hypothetical protein
MAGSRDVRSSDEVIIDDDDDDDETISNKPDDDGAPDFPVPPVAKRKRGRPPKSASHRPAKKAVKPSAASTSSKANATVFLIEAQKKLHLKKKTGASDHTTAVPVYTSWVHQHWKPENSTEYGEEVTFDNFAKLQAAKPQMVCKHCSKIMSWAPSTNRKKHLCLNCKQFAATDDFKAPEVQQDVQTFMKRTAASKGVRSFKSDSFHCPHVDQVCFTGSMFELLQYLIKRCQVMLHTMSLHCAAGLSY